MKVYDVSMTISKNIQVYKNKPEKKPTFEVVSDFDYASSHETNMTFNLHTGTHMDFPLHMIPFGETSDTLDLARLIREVKVFDLSHLKDCIDIKDVEKLDIQKDDFVLFKTKNSEEENFNFKFIYLNDKASKYLAERKIKGVGVDGLGVERDQPNHPTHKTLFKHDIIIIEGLRLKEVNEGVYMMYALPIKIKGVDALPLSVILTKE
ncbi:cyclase family protein [Peloplasma aerotolerans]|uniref:Cyclase family protein n=1 Tax=Peloplasma aerotolerans TaxID=3044389 RepID=A0AAW6UAM8_9MOLU|nr:cyclase family protein [Mariniplasma sp. M4Ah]MDI6452989.1 cyclase family protein [Mariniplasma sp. M4Ah]